MKTSAALRPKRLTVALPNDSPIVAVDENIHRVGAWQSSRLFTLEDPLFWTFWPGRKTDPLAKLTRTRSCTGDFVNFWFRTILAALATLVPFSSPTAKELKKNLPIHPPSSQSSIEPLQNLPGGIRVFCTIETRCDLDEFVRKTGVCAFFVIKGRTTRVEKYNGTDTCEEGKNGPYKDYSIASMAKSLTSTLVGQVLAERYNLRTREQFERIMTRKMGKLSHTSAQNEARGWIRKSLDG
ncbi:hypothetical protein ACOJBO_46305 [Rhizobium beringeri]